MKTKPRTTIEFKCERRKCRSTYKEDTAEPNHYRAYQRAEQAIKQAGWTTTPQVICNRHK